MSDYAAARQHMVDGQIRPRDVTNLHILDAMLSIPREQFLPESQRALAYLDLDIALAGNSEAGVRYVVQPVVIARLLQEADLKPTDRVLVVGCTTGYSAALASRLAGEVVATESSAELVTQARQNLSGAEFAKVRIEQAPAAEGWCTEAPYDAIIFDGATEVIPDQLYHQLGEGGRLVGVFADEQPQRALLITRTGDEFGSRVLFDVTTPILPGLERKPEFVF